VFEFRKFIADSLLSATEIFMADTICKVASESWVKSDEYGRDNTQLAISSDP
jgi:hypothetical protein